MHSAVMQNKKYIKFAEANTVEVLSLSRLREAAEKGESKAGTYKKKGDDNEYMVEWPNLTLEMIENLNRSKAGTYNQTGKIPYTCIVDPHTEKELGKGYRSSSDIQDAVKTFKKQLEKEHGKGLARKQLKKVDGAIAGAEKLTAEGQFAKALKSLKKEQNAKTPQVLSEKLSAAEKVVIAAAQKALDDVLASDSPQKKRELSRLASRLRGTGLEDKAKEAIRNL